MFLGSHCRRSGFSIASRFLGGILLLCAVSLSFADTQHQLDLMLEEESFPGIAWSVIGEDGPLAGGNGYADLTTARTMSAHTRVHVGSVTKVLVAMGILHLVSEGQLSLDSTVEDMLPALNWENPWRNEAPITVRHLLEHTAGLDNLRIWQFLNSEVTGNTPLSDAFPQSHEQLLQLRTRPGSQYSYSNMGYALLGLVIEKVTSTRYEDYLGRELLMTLGMHDSSFFFVTQAQDSRLAMGYIDGGVPQSAVAMFLRPAGQFTTTAADMQILLNFLLGNGVLNGEVFIATEHMDSLGTPSTTDAYRAGLSLGHGLALASRDRHGVLGECHPGETFGFRARICLFRQDGKAFFYAINADFEGADYERFTKHFIERIDIEPLLVAPATANVDLEKHTGLYRLAPAIMAEFAWLDWMFNSIWLSVDSERNGLVMHSLQGEQRLLLPLENGLFRDAERNMASFVFLGDQAEVLSNGLISWKRSSLFSLGLGWLSLLTGVFGLLYLLVRGFWSLLHGPTADGRPLLIPWLCLLAFALPVYLYTKQSYLQFGEFTLASATLAALSCLLPVCLVFAAYRMWSHQGRSNFDQVAVLFSLQLCLVMFQQGALPLVFWQ
ncbi:serine hydrolase domain-containing protein [Congregibacter brevis]|uniref:Serine hydrolase domain-containing protein n=1 Tax=Congregibacter brevis TaxID=3081201 RepID=A0ABZ0IEG3_9GAMM|nr:serine hydrolase domain-containing protein [Congregibacter sp. IMCC45268]